MNFHKTHEHSRAALLGLLGLSACGEISSTGAEARLAQEGSTGEVTFTEVTSAGSGCPPGTTNTRISPDGLVFTMTFSSYVTAVNPSVDLTVRDCHLNIRLHVPEGRSYAVQSLSYAGFALLQEGVIGRQTASYYFEGHPIPPVESNRTELTGPYDSAYLFTDEVAEEQRSWSPCGTERNLTVLTRVQLFNSNMRRAGYMNMSAVDGSSRMVLKLSARTCSLTPPPTAPLVKASQVTVLPGVIRRDQPFTVRWTSPASDGSAMYRVQLRTPVSRGDRLVWESPEIFGSAVKYDGPPLSAAGIYDVLVMARRGAQEQASDRATLEVRDGAPADPAGASPASALLGRYAVRVASYWQAYDGVRPVRDLYLADFVQVGDDIELHGRICDQKTTTPGYVLTLVTPEAVPMFRRKVLVEGTTWRTDGDPISVGYVRSGVPACAGRAGQSVPKDPAQRWIDGATCRCPRSASSEPTLEDCRVVDPDGDGQPGLTYELFSSSRSVRLEYFAGIVRSHPVRGRIDPRGAHSAEWKLDEVSYRLDCSSDSECDVGSGGEDPCETGVNRAVFVPLREPPLGQAEWTCAALRGSQSRLFPDDRSTPSYCEGDPATDRSR